MMADESRDEKREQMEVFDDILKGHYKLRKELCDMELRFCKSAIKILEKY